ncbi:MAG TPA: hypothetical protein QF604_02595 [Candidatus Latescibacteria bacterium]|nr:hypothetical protein [Planctomycetota bacterium]HJN26785.1 hypothetical protein [Candidatus Latescibacterota bacterium]
MLDCSHYAVLATVFLHPASEFPRRVRAVEDHLKADYPAAAERLGAFIDLLPGDGDVLSDEERDSVQELFTRSFEVQAITTLDVGYVMFGDDYKRAELMVNLNREHREAGTECGTELPDHLPNVLQLLAVWKDPALVMEFVQEILHPALVRMIEEFDDKRIEQRNVLYRKHYKTLIDWDPERSTMYREALSALLLVIESDFTLVEGEPLPETSQFLSSIGREMDIEERGEGQRPTMPDPIGPTGCTQPQVQLSEWRNP